MKRNLLKRIGAVALAAAVSLTMGTAAFAADTGVNTDGTWDDTSHGINSSKTTLNVAKEIVFKNSESTTVRQPNITYTYTIASATPGEAKITDADGITVNVKAGLTAAVTPGAATVAFVDTDTADATAAGNALKKYASFTFDNAKFTDPGVYRYSITESTNVTKASVGITPEKKTETSAYDPVRYLDVYVKKNAAGTACEIYGYVLFEGTATTVITSSDVSMKSEGYVNTATASDEQADVDVYKTENLAIYKTITGTMADVNNKFPVSIAMTKASGLSNGIKLDFTASENAELTKTDTDAKGDYVTMDNALAGKVGQDSVITITGIPYGSTAAVTETNNAPDSYKVSAGKTATTTEFFKDKIVATNGTATVDAQTLNAKVSIYITNKLDAISPTNVVMRFAPFLFIFGAAILLLVVMRRRRTQDAE